MWLLRLALQRPYQSTYTFPGWRDMGFGVRAASRSTALPALCPAAASREAMDAAVGGSWGMCMGLHGAAPSPGGESWLSASCPQRHCPAARLLFKVVFLLTLNHLNKKIIQQKTGTCGVPPELPPSGDAFLFPSTLRSISQFSVYKLHTSVPRVCINQADG